MAKKTIGKLKSVNGKIDGKLPPQAIELEEAVLGALMLDNEALSDTIDILRPEYFYKMEHQKIFDAIIVLFNESKPVDILTVIEELKKLDIKIIYLKKSSIPIINRSKKYNTQSLFDGK